MYKIICESLLKLCTKIPAVRRWSILFAVVVRNWRKCLDVLESSWFMYQQFLICTGVSIFLLLKASEWRKTIWIQNNTRRHSGWWIASSWKSVLLQYYVQWQQTQWHNIFGSKAHLQKLFSRFVLVYKWSWFRCYSSTNVRSIRNVRFWRVGGYEFPSCFLYILQSTFKLKQKVRYTTLYQ